MHKIGLSLLVIVTFSSLTLAMPSDFESYVQSEMQEFKAYKDAQDEAFGKYLETAWKPFKARKTRAKLKPKPRVIKPIPIKKVDKPVVKKEVVVKVIPRKVVVKPVVVTLPKAVVTPKTVDASKTKVLFYGHQFFIKYDNPLENIYGTMLNSKKITKAWEAFASSEYEGIIKQIDQNVKLLALNDWGRLKLLEKISQPLFRNGNEGRLFRWFVLTKLGYDMKVGFSRQKVLLLAPINTKLYSTTFYDIKGTRYYAIDYTYGKKGIGTIRTYEKSHPKARGIFDLRITKRPNLKTFAASKDVSFTYKKKKYKLKMDYDRAFVAYFKSYPQVDYDNYFLAPVSPTANATIRSEVAKLIKGKGEVEAVNILMRLVQKGFDYKVDHAQFGYEKVMLPEETLYYPFSDCEDRAILFSKLVRDLLGLEVVGLKFKDHLANAVVLKSTLRGGTSFKKNGKRYYVADPTYIGSTVGMMPPRYKNAPFSMIYAK